MITRTVKAQLLAFATVTAVGVSYVAAEYSGLADRILGSGYTVRADFSDSGGIFTGAEVAYRGVPVGRVGHLRLSRGGGVSVDLDVTDGTPIPADTLAVVADRSAVGEQYVDLQPRRASRPFLHDGSTIPRRDTRIPLPTTALISSVDRLVGSVNKGDLKITVDELGKAFAGTGPHLGRLVDSGNALVESADGALPETVSLIENSRTVLKTQVDEGSSIKAFSHDLSDLTRQLKDSDGDVRTLLDNGPAAAGQLDGLLKANQSALPVLLGNLVSGGQVTVARLPGVEQALVTFPSLVASTYTVLPGDGTAHFGLALNVDDPPPCRKGYGTTRKRDPLDTQERPANTRAHCAAPRGSTTSVRGAQNAPGAPGRPYGSGADQAAYDPATGTVTGPDGQIAQIGSTGGEQNVFGKDSWQWLLVGPMT
ncbi:MlaD family protein [Streptomyces sp. NPDC046805]|uniref:MlaD family protein n=1 Tax=Streptomyces sp. NPDC046805 TaxID=3155134 RepID=UPI0033FAF1CE